MLLEGFISIWGNEYTAEQVCDVFCEMRVVPYDVFRDHGRIPRSSDGLTVASSGIEDDALVVFVSHRWLRPTMGDPDDEQHSKHAAVCAAIKAITSSSTTKSRRPVYLWIVSSRPLLVTCALSNAS